jgi:uncharacterized FAD-dependent dehydrogenase
MSPRGDASESWDVIVVGAGPAGLFAARTLAGKMRVLVIDEKARTGGAGAMTDGKLNLSPHIGLDLDELQLSEGEAADRIARIDDFFLEHGADRTLYGSDEERIAFWEDRVSWVRRRTHKGAWDITLRPARQRHMGTDLAHKVVARMTEAIRAAGAEFSLGNRVEDVFLREKGPFIVRSSKGLYAARYLLAAPGRDGAYWFREVARSLGVRTRWGAIDIGCRVEVALPVFEEITRVLYDPKFLFVTPTHGDRTRTFCTNPGGRVRVEIRNGCRLVNGDALKQRKTSCTNFAILNTVSMTEPLQDTTEMGRKVMEFANFWGGGDSLIAQRWGDLTEGRRSKAETFYSESLGYDKMMPTLPLGPGVTPGDISYAYPGRIVDNLRESLLLLSRVIPGVAHPSTTVYVPEIKFYDTKYATDRFLETNVSDLFVSGDGVGKSRGIVGAALNGMLAAEGILRKEGKA